MSDNIQSSSAVKTSKQWAKIMLAWNVFVEYLDDYLSGNKFKRHSVLNRVNQKQK